MSCKPTQMPRKGLPSPLHGLLQRLDHAGDVREPLLAIGKGADAGQHDALGRRHTSSGRAVTLMAGSDPCSRAARSKALAAEWRLPEP